MQSGGADDEPSDPEPEQAHPPPRWADGDGEPERSVPIDQIDSNDVMGAVRDLFSDGAERDRETALRDLAAALGYQRLGPRIRETLDNDLRTAVRRGILDNAPHGLRLLCRSVGEYTREHLVRMLMSDIADGWLDRDTLIRDTARYLGFRRTGSEIRKALKSAINGAIRRGLLEYEGDRVRKAR